MLNINGWTTANSDLCEKLLTAGNPEIICITETHLKGNDYIEIPQYVCMNSNRIVKSHKGSGGVAILYKKSLQNIYECEEHFRLNDNVIGLKIKNKLSMEQILIYCVYLPPENSKYSQNNESILNHLTIDIYRNQEVDIILVCGDLNARIGNKNDCAYFDSIPVRKILEEGVNQQGQKLLSFIHETHTCILNGRITPNLDDFTSVTSYRGCAVVDYGITRQTDLHKIIEMKVESCVQMVSDLGLTHMLSTSSYIPDHNKLCITLELSEAIGENVLTDQNLGSKPFNRQKV